MNVKYTEKMKELAARESLWLDTRSGMILYGERNGYKLILESSQNFYPLLLSFSVSKNGGMPYFKDVKQMIRGHKSVVRCSVQRYQVTFTIRAASFSTDKCFDYIRQAIAETTALLRENGYTDCCQNCGAHTETAPYIVGGMPMNLCPGCFTNLSGSNMLRQSAEKQKQENLVGGIVGALLGALLGAAAILLIGQLGYVSVISGLIMAFCTLKGYEMLAGKLSKKGIVICVLMMIVLTYVGDRADWALMVAKYYDVSFSDSYKAIPALLQEDYIEAGTYYENLAFTYLFVAAGAIPTAIQMMKKKRLEKITYKLNASSIPAIDEIEGL